MQPADQAQAPRAPTSSRTQQQPANKYAHNRSRTNTPKSLARHTSHNNHQNPVTSSNNLDRTYQSTPRSHLPRSLIEPTITDLMLARSRINAITRLSESRRRYQRKPKLCPNTAQPEPVSDCNHAPFPALGTWMMRREEIGNVT